MKSDKLDAFWAKVDEDKAKTRARWRQIYASIYPPEERDPFIAFKKHYDKSMGKRNKGKF